MQKSYHQITHVSIKYSLVRKPKFSKISQFLCNNIASTLLKCCSNIAPLQALTLHLAYLWHNSSLAEICGQVLVWMYKSGCSSLCFTISICEKFHWCLLRSKLGPHVQLWFYSTVLMQWYVCLYLFSQEAIMKHCKAKICNAECNTQTNVPGV